MAIDLNIQTPDKLVKKTFELPVSIAEAFEQYVEAAQEDTVGVNEHLVMRALIERQLKRDRKFRKWLSERQRDEKGVVADSEAGLSEARA